MVFFEGIPNTFLLACYETIMRNAPLDYMEAAERYALKDLYFVADIPTKLFTDNHLHFHYTDQ
jgi:hypothetical protein